MTTPFPRKLIAVAILGLGSGAASASGFHLLEQNASGLGNAYAGSAAVAENASTIYFNPAGLTLLGERSISVGATVVATSYEFSNRSSSVDALATTGDGNDGGTVRTIPNAYMSLALTRDLYLGLGIGSPFGVKTDFSTPWIGGAQSLKFDLKTINVNPTVAYRVGSKLSLGFGLDWQQMKLDYQRIAGTTPALSTATATFKADDTAWGWNAGLLWQVSPSMRVGAAYRSSLDFDLAGNYTVSNSAALTGAARAKIEVPDIFTLSVSQLLDDHWEMMGDLSRTGWAKINKVQITYGDGTSAQTVDASFRNTWRLALGANYLFSDAWKLKFGIAYEQSPVRDPEHRLAALPDNNRLWLSVGGQWQPTRDSALDVGLAYLYIKDGEIANDQTADTRGLVSGMFGDSAWILGVQYSMNF